MVQVQGRRIIGIHIEHHRESQPHSFTQRTVYNLSAVSTAAELAGLNEKYQNEACKLLSEAGQVTLNAAKLLKAQQEQERDIPGQMTIDQALHPHKPEEINTPVPVDVQIDRFYESLRKNIETYVKKSDLNMTTYMLSALYGTVRVRNGQLNYQGSKEGILFNIGSDQEELMSWTESGQDGSSGRTGRKNRWTSKMYYGKISIRNLRSCSLLQHDI